VNLNGLQEYLGLQAGSAREGDGMNSVSLGFAVEIASLWDHDNPNIFNQDSQCFKLKSGLPISINFPKDQIAIPIVKKINGRAPALLLNPPGIYQSQIGRARRFWPDTGHCQPVPTGFLSPAFHP
jgi:hypothetical protein